MRIVKPTTSGQRGVIFEDRSYITSKTPVQSLVAKIKKTGGRDRFGHISTRHIGGGSKRHYRIVDFGPGKVSNSAVVKTLEYDPNRNTPIALIKYTDGEVRYILAPTGMKVGDTIDFATQAKIKNGNRTTLKYIPTGIPIHNIELTPSSKAKVVRAAGTNALILSKDSEFANIKLPSGEVRRFSLDCFASIGQLANIEHKAISIGKAGRMRHMGIRPTVRGKVMNPADHPHGGGEGSTSIGLKYPKTPWGKPALGVKTRKPKKASSAHIVKRRK